MRKTHSWRGLTITYLHVDPEILFGDHAIENQFNFINEAKQNIQYSAILFNFNITLINSI